MLEIVTKRLVGISDMEIANGKLKPIKRESRTINLFDLRPTTGRESAFVFFDKNNMDSVICHIGVTWQRNRFEVTYGTEEPYRRQGFLQESLSAFLTWVKENTEQKEVWGLPNGPESEHILQKCGFEYCGKVENSSSKWYRFHIPSEA